MRAGRWADSAKMMAAARAAEDDRRRRARLLLHGRRRPTATRRRRWAWPTPRSTRPAPTTWSSRCRAARPPRAWRPPRTCSTGRRRGGRAGAAAARRAARSMARAEGDVAVISVPGEYAALEAHKALGAGMDVLLFSDGVSARGRGRPEAPRPRPRPPGDGPRRGDRHPRRRSRSASPTSSRPAASAWSPPRAPAPRRSRCCSTAPGRGVSRCYGTGGRDLKDEVGAITALDAIARLAADEGTDVILCVSKPPSPEVAERVLRALAGCGKPAAACMVGGGVEPVDGRPPGAHARGGRPGRRAPGRPSGRAGPGPARRLGRGRRGARALLRGHALQRGVGDPRRAARDGELERPGGPRAAAAGRAGGARLPGPRRGGVHPRPAPPDDRPRGPRRAPASARRPTRTSACCCSTSCSGTPATPTRPGRSPRPIRSALSDRPQLAVVAYVLGTEDDPQVRSRQEATLADAGARLAPTNAAAARLAAALAG